MVAAEYTQCDNVTWHTTRTNKFSRYEYDKFEYMYNMKADMKSYIPLKNVSHIFSCAQFF